MSPRSLFNNLVDLCPSDQSMTLPVGWIRGLQIVFLWDDVNNQKYVWIILLKMTFWISQGTWATSNRWDGQSVRFRVKFFQDFTCQKSLKSVIFDGVIQKIKGGRFLGQGVECISCYISVEYQKFDGCCRSGTTCHNIVYLKGRSPYSYIYSYCS